VNDEKLIVNLDSIVKQLQKISATIGISVGVSSDKNGKPKIKSTLDANEKAREKNLFKEIELQYETMLGRVFSSTRNADAQANAVEFITAINKTSLITNINKVKDGIESLASASNVPVYSKTLDIIDQNIEKIAKGQKDYEPKLNEMIVNLQGIQSNIQSVLSTSNTTTFNRSLDILEQNIEKLANGQKDYEPKLNEMIVNLQGIQSNIESNSINPPMVIRMWGLLLRKMKWEDFRITIMDYFVRAETKASEVSDYLSDLIQVNKDILNKKSTPTTGESSLTKIGNVAGLMALGVGLIFIVNALIKSNLIDTGNVLKVLFVVGAVVSMFLLVGKIAGTLKDAAKGFAIFSATMMFIVLPLIYALVKTDKAVIAEGLVKMAVIFTACLGILKLMEYIKPSDVINQTKGIALFALTVGFLIVPLIVHLTSISKEIMAEGLTKLAIVVGACFGILKLMERIKPGDVVKSVAGLSLFSLVLNFLIVPMLIRLSNLDWAALLKGLANASIAIVGMGLIAIVIGQLAKSGTSNMIAGAATIGILTFILGYLGDTLNKLAGKDWAEIYKGLGFATLAITLFGLAVFAIGLAVFGPQALLLAAGAATVMVLSFVVGYLADSLAKFAGKNWNEITFGLKESIKAIAAFGAVLTGIGLAAVLAAPLLSLGAGAVMFMANTAGLLAANLEEFAGRDWDSIIPGLKGASVGIGMFSVVVTTMGAIVKNFGIDMLVKGSNAIIGISLVAGVLAQNLMKFAYKPWNNIIKGLTQSTIAMTKFSLFVGAVGLFSKIVEKGIDTVYEISDLIGNIADNLVKFENVEGINFEQIGKGLTFLGEGLKSMFFGSLSNLGSSMIDSITGFFNMDPVSKIKKFETINSDKIYQLGLGLKYMGEGLRNLSKDIDISTLVKDLTLLSKPVIDLAQGISEFSDAYSKFQAVRIESDINQIKNINLQSENGIKDEIKLASELQLEVLRDQLAELRKNNQLMEILVSNKDSKQINQSGGFIQNTTNKDSLYSPSFSTKENYRGNLKLTSMSFSG
jgi:hypothetical protein